MDWRLCLRNSTDNTKFFFAILGCTEVQFFFVIDVIRTALHSQGIGYLIFDNFEAGIDIDSPVHLLKTSP